MLGAKKDRHIGKHACEACRKSKIRCLTETLEQHGRCRRCHTQGLACEWKEIAKTRTRKRTDTRVAELEKQMLIMSAAMQDMEAKGNTATGSDMSAATSSSSHLFPGQGQALSDVQCEGLSASSPSPYARLPVHVPTPGSTLSHQTNVHGPGQFPMYRFDAHRRGELLHVFRAMLLPAYPITSVAPETPASVLEGARPFALNSMITGACILSEPESFLHMHEATVKLLAHHVFVLGHKSLDLVHALLITATWCGLPENLGNINIFQWTQVAGTMAVELGLIGRTSKQAQAQDLAQLTGVLSDQMMERVRTSLSVYLSCSRIAVSFRRQVVASYRPSITALMDAFSRHMTKLGDRRLLAWLRLQLIVEDVESMKQGVETRAEATALGYETFKDDFELFSDRLQEWEKATDPELINESLRTDFCFYKSKLHELAIYFDDDTRHLELGQLASATEGVSAGVRPSLNPIYVRILLSFINDCHSILKIILTADTQVIRAMPVLTMFRTPYAFKALAMLEQRALRVSDDISKIIDQQTLQWEYYAKNVSQVLEHASQGRLYSVPTMALRIRDCTVKGQQLRSIAEANGQSGAGDQISAGSVSWHVETLQFPNPDNELPDFDFAMEAWDNELWTSDYPAYQ